MLGLIDMQHGHLLKATGWHGHILKSTRDMETSHLYPDIALYMIVIHINHELLTRAMPGRLRQILAKDLGKCQYEILMICHQNIGHTPIQLRWNHPMEHDLKSHKVGDRQWMIELKCRAVTPPTSTHPTVHNPSIKCDGKCLFSKRKSTDRNIQKNEFSVRPFSIKRGMADIFRPYGPLCDGRWMDGWTAERA